jgi:hypothetical protein
MLIHKRFFADKERYQVTTTLSATHNDGRLFDPVKPIQNLFDFLQFNSTTSDFDLAVSAPNELQLAV